MKKTVIILSIIILLCGCLEEGNYPKKNKYAINYNIDDIIIFEKNDTYRGFYNNDDYYFNSTFLLDKNAVSLSYDVLWTTHRLKGPNSTTAPYVNYNYTLIIQPPDVFNIQCIPSNNASNTTDLNNVKGNLVVYCTLNNIPINTSIEAYNPNEVEGNIIEGNIGEGEWEFKLNVLPKKTHSYVDYNSSWEVSITSQYYTPKIVEIK